MKKLILLTFLTLLCITQIHAQTRSRYSYPSQRDWYLTPSIAFMNGNNNEGMITAVTIGRYLDKGSNFSMEGTFGYFFSEKENDYQFFSAMVSYDGNLFRSRVFYGGIAAGLGIMTDELSSSKNRYHEGFTDAALPMKVSFGFILSRNLSIGANLGYYLDMTVVERSMLQLGGTINVRF